MMKALKKLSGHKQSSASVVDGKLILSFPHAITPVVWQMDLDQVKASALEVLENAQKKCFTLTLKTAKGEKLEAASFETREEAVSGLLAASKALENAHGNIRSIAMPANQDISTAASMPRPATKPRPGRWIAGILGVLLLLALYSTWASMTPQSRAGFNATSADTAAPATGSPSDTGVPVSADDFLNSL